MTNTKLCITTVAAMYLIWQPQLRCAVNDCAVTGQVTDWKSGAIIAHARIELIPIEHSSASTATDSESAVGATAVASAEGRFCFKNVPSGEYQLVGRKNGFLDTKLGTSSVYGAARILSVGRGEGSERNGKVEYQLRLLPQAVISGKVIDALREPADSGTVKLLGIQWVGGKRRRVTVASVQLNDLGEFRFAHLASGTYYVVFEPQISNLSKDSTSASIVTRPVRTFYPSALTTADATSIELRTGGEVRGADIVIQQRKSYRITGSLSSANGVGSAKPGGINIMPRDEEPTSLVISNSNISPDGTFHFGNVAPGEYMITYVASTETGTLIARASVDVVDTDVTGVMLSIPPASSVRGSVLVEGAGISPDLTEIEIILTPVDSLIAPSFRTRVGADGAFLLPECSAGKYLVAVTAPKGFYVKALRNESEEVSDWTLTINGGVTSLGIILRRGTGQIQGIVEAPNSNTEQAEAAPSAYYVVMPVGGSPSNIRFGQIDSKRSFIVADLPPGKYQVCSLENLNLSALQNPSVAKSLLSFGSLVDLKEDEKVQLAIPIVSTRDAGRILEM